MAQEFHDDESPNCRVGASIIIVCFEAGASLNNCLEALNVSLWHEVILVDNASTDLSIPEAVARWPSLKEIRSEENLGFAGGANLGADHASGEILIFLNPDTVARSEALVPLVESLRASPGVRGPVLVHRGIHEEAGAVIDVVGLPWPLRGGDRRLPLYVGGCCLATNRFCFEEIGGFDARFFMFVEDVEYCWQALRHGYDVGVDSGVTVYHHGGESAPGGYSSEASGKSLEISISRLLLRERNTTAMLLSCAPRAWLPLVLGLSVLRTLAFGCLMARLGAWRSIGGLLVGQAEAVRWCGWKSGRRLSNGVTVQGSRRGWRRVAKRFFLVDHLLRGRSATLVGAKAVAADSAAWRRSVGREELEGEG